MCIDLKKIHILTYNLFFQVETSFFHVDSSHDLAITFNIPEFGSATIKFPRAETFSTTAKPSGNVFSLTETMTFNSDLSDGNLC